MRYTELVTELYNANAAFELEWNDTFGPEERSARARDSSGGYIDIRFIPVANGIVEVEFSRNDSYDVTGEGEASRVLATVLEAFRDYLRGYQPKILIFASKGQSRTKLYQSLINRFASSVGYQQFDINKLKPETREKISMSGSDVMVLRKTATAESMKDSGDTMRYNDIIPENFDKNAYDQEDYFVVRQQSERDKENNTPSKFWDQVSRHDSLGDAQQTIEKLRQQNPNNKFSYTMHRRTQGVAEGLDDNGISFQVQKGKNKFATTLSMGNNPVGVYQYNATTGRSIAEVYPEFKGKGLGKLLVLHAIYTATQLGLDFQEDESRTSEYDNVLDSLSSNGYIVDDDGYWYVTGEGEQYLKQSLKQGVAEATGDEKFDTMMSKMTTGAMDREFTLVMELGKLGQRIVQNPKLWARYQEANDSNDTDWIISLIQDGTGATFNEVLKLSDLFGEIGGGMGRIIDFAWAVKEGHWEEDFLNPYREYRSQGVNEFAPPGSGDGDDGFSDETLKRMAAQWYHGDEDPRVEQALAAAGWEIGQDEGYDDEPGVFVVQSGDVNGNSYMSWSAQELQGMAENQLDEKWSQKYKSSINCASPRGFSQKAHCAGRKKNESVTENAEELNVGDPVIITGNVEFQGKTGDIDSFGDMKRFVVVNLYNHGKHSFHSSDVEYNDYADSDDERRDSMREARANTAGVRAGLAKRKTTAPLSPEEQIAKDRAKFEKWKAKNQKPEKDSQSGSVAEGAVKNYAIQQVVDQLLDGDLDPYDVMSRPQGPAQEQMAMVLQDMYDDVAQDYRLHPDDDFEQIFDRVMDRLEDDYGHSQEQQGMGEGAIITKDQLVDIYIKGKGKNNMPIQKKVGAQIPNSKVESFIAAVADKYGLNPKAFVYGPSRSMSEDAAGVGVVASKKQKNDPRYSMSLTKDVRPGEVARNMKKLHLEGNRGYNHGFASPTAPSLGRRGREDDEYHVPDPTPATWYIRANGKIIKDKMGSPFQFRDKEAARKAAMTMMSKSFNAGKKFVLTTRPEDEQPVAEAGKGISKDAETKFHAKLDQLVHDTFGKRKSEKK
jgi:GNAT superfamily N-acetyltransferase